MGYFTRAILKAGVVFLQNDKYISFNCMLFIACFYPAVKDWLCYSCASCMYVCMNEYLISNFITSYGPNYSMDFDI